MEDLFNEISGLTATYDRFKVPSMVYSFSRIYLSTLYYMILAWYFDNVLSSNRGHAKPFYFFLVPTYWLGESRSHKKITHVNKSNVNNRKPSFSINDLHHHKTNNTAVEER